MSIKTFSTLELLTVVLSTYSGSGSSDTVEASLLLSRDTSSTHGIYLWKKKIHDTTGVLDKLKIVEFYERYKDARWIIGPEENNIVPPKFPGATNFLSDTMWVLGSLLHSPERIFSFKFPDSEEPKRLCLINGFIIEISANILRSYSIPQFYLQYKEKKWLVL